MREAIVSLSSEELSAIGLGDLMERFSEAGLVKLQEVECRANGGVVQIETRSRVRKDELSRLESVNEWELVNELGDTYLYLVDFTAPELPGDMTDVADSLVGTCDPQLGEDDARLSFTGSHEAIRSLLMEYEDSGVEPQLEKLGSYEGDTHPLDVLTERQAEILETAYRLGYYDVPRTVSTDELAGDLGLDASTVSEHLQRAEHNLLKQHFRGE